jgi:hypothetical protein
MCVGPNAVSSSPVIVNTIRGPHSRMASVRDRQNLISPRRGLLGKTVALIAKSLSDHVSHSYSSRDASRQPQLRVGKTRSTCQTWLLHG